MSRAYAEDHNESEAPNERIKDAREVLQRIPELELMEGSAREFLLGSNCVPSEIEDLVLLDAVALAGLHRQQVTLCPSFWKA
jgi:hypothetical protein